MPTTRRVGTANRNPTPWVTRRRTLIDIDDDIDEVDEQNGSKLEASRNGSRSSTVQCNGGGSQPVVTQSHKNSRLSPKRSEVGKSRMTPTPRIKIHATSAKRFFRQIRDRSARTPSIQGTARPEPRSVPDTEASQSAESPQACQKRPISPPNYGGYSPEMIQDEISAQESVDEPANGGWVCADSAVPELIIGQLTTHQGQRGRWHLSSEAPYSHQQNWVFIPDEEPTTKRSRQRPRKKQKDRVSFSSLPGELRNKIYAHAIPECRILITATKPNKEMAKLKSTWSEQDVHHKRPKTKLNHVLDTDQIYQGFALTISLLLTCRKIRDDVELYLYSRTTFCFQSNNVLERFLNTASKPGLRAIRKLEIDHQGYSNPEASKDRIFREKYYAKWMKTCTQVGNALTGLEELKLDAILRKWPCEFAALNESNDMFKKACLQLAPRRIMKVKVTLQHPMIQNNRNVLIDLAHALEDQLMTKEGKEARDNWEHEQVVKAIEATKKAAKEARAKARRAKLLASKPLKPLSITKEETAIHKAMPVKVYNKGLEKFHRIDTSVMCPEELDTFKYTYGLTNQKLRADCWN